jgi:hypothetical protein
LTFLLLVLDVKLAIKIVAVGLVYLMRPNFRFGFRFDSFRNSRLPWFYCLAPAIALLNWAFSGGYSDLSVDVLLLNCLFYWILSILIIHQIKLFTEKSEPEKIHGTISFFFLLNILVSVGNLLVITLITRSINPYQYEGMDQKYFIGTGDHINGITFDFSLTNAVINALALAYFIRKKKYGMAMASMSVLLLTGSNFTNMLIVPVLIYFFFVQSSKIQKAVVAGCFLLMFVFLRVVSPENKDYTRDTFEKLAGEKTFAINPKEASPPPTAQQQTMVKSAEPIEKKYVFVPTPQQTKWPGKAIAYMETFQFLEAHPAKILTGNGAGRFSSKLAFRASSLGMSGGYPAKFSFVDPDFLHNHLSLYLYYFTKGSQHHSILNTPNSVYNQLAGEYGLIGLLTLAFFYFGFFMRSFRQLTFGIPALWIIAGTFLTDYWFEQLSVVILFELLLFLDIRENTPLAKIGVDL